MNVYNIFFKHARRVTELEIQRRILDDYVAEMSELTTDSEVGHKCVELIHAAVRYERLMVDMEDHVMDRHVVDWFMVYRQMLVYMYA